MVSDAILLEWFIHGRLVGISNTYMTWTRELRHVPYSIVRYCHSCGDVWSKIRVVHSDTKWIAKPRICSKCLGGPVPLGELDDSLYELPCELGPDEMQAMISLGGEHEYKCFLSSGGI